MEVVIACLALALGCKAEASAAPDADAVAGEVASREPALVVEHGEPLPYWGTWVGPELRLSFAGPWVLIGPRGAEPIELRVGVERRAGEAFALRTSVAGRYAADFVRPSDWTLLVEDGALALAMGDEPLSSYPAADAPLLVGPVMLDAIAVPDTIAPQDVLACLEVASEACRELESEGPRAAGCREAQWGVCTAHLDPGQPDPTVRAATVIATAIHARQVALRFAEAVLASAPAKRRGDAEALRRRALEQAAATLAELRKDGPLPSSDPHLPALLVALREAGLEPETGTSADPGFAGPGSVRSR